MPIRLVSQKELPRLTRESKITRSSEWDDLTEALRKGIPSGKVLRVSFSPDTLKKEFGGDARKAVQGFVFRLRAEYADRFTFKVAGKEVWVTNKEK